MEEIINSSDKRVFKILSQDGKLIGKYLGGSPYQAANKALSEIIRSKIKNKENINNDIEFNLIEINKNKVHMYAGSRQKLENPISYMLSNGQIIVKNYKNILKKIKIEKYDNENSI